MQKRALVSVWRCAILGAEIGGICVENCFDRHLSDRELGEMSVLALAHLGDAVFELLARSRLCAHSNARVNELHRRTVSLVSAGAQAKRMEKMLPLLTERELAWYKRGRNAHAHHDAPKNASPGDYAMATGLECLVGVLFLTGETARANELFVLTSEDDHGV